MSGALGNIRSQQFSLALLAAAALCGQPLKAQDLPPQKPQTALDFADARPVVEINEQCEVVVTLDDEKRAVSLAGVSAPMEPALRAQLREFLTRLLRDEEVVVREIEESPDEDDQPRSAHLFRSPDGLFVNVEVVRLGYAKARLDRQSEHYDRFRDGQRRAKRAELGVWGPPPPPAVKSAPQAADSSVENGDITVYVTKSGKKYHRAECRHLAKSSRALTLKEALEKGYEPCKVCKPPTRDDP